jgi:lysophospholipase L1-like esterase
MEKKKIFQLGKVLYHTAIMFVVLDLFLGSLLYRQQRNRESREFDTRKNVSAYNGQAWVAEYFTEFAESNVRTYQPFIGWLRKNYAGRYINIHNGQRQTYHPVLMPAQPLRIYAFGGSTMWGTGARDEYSIPSYLAKLAEHEGIALEVKNFGESAFVNWQGVIRLADLCANGDIPDLVVFYEGANDVVAKLQTPSLKRVHQNFSQWQQWIEHHNSIHNWLQNYSLLYRTAHGLGRRRHIQQQKNNIPAPEVAERLAHEVVTTYSENAAFVRRLAETYGFQVWFFWQPVVYTKKHPTEEERTYQKTGFGELITTVYHAATAQVPRYDFAVDLSTSFDNQDRTIYIDWAHVTEEGNAIVAGNIYRTIQPTLHRLAITRNGAS